jgi:hypothetical protein
LWDVGTGKNLRTFEGDTRRTVAVAISPDGKQVLSGGYDDTGFLWDKVTGQKLRTFQKPRLKPAFFSGMQSVAFRMDGKQILTGSSDGLAILWDTTSGEKVRQFTCDDRVLAVAYGPEAKQIQTVSLVATTIWNADTGQKLAEYTGNIGIHSVAFSPDSKSYLTGWYDGRVILREAATGRILRTFKGDPNWVMTVAFRPDGKQILTGTWGGPLRIWDVATGDELAQLISINQGENWAVVTPEGLFDGSRRGRENVFFRVDQTLDIVPLDRFFQDFYYPGLLAAIWRGERPMPGKPFRTNPAPLVRMLTDPAGGDRKDLVAIDVAVTDQGGGVSGPWLQHNGATLRGGQLLKKDGKTAVYRFTVSLIPGDNRLEARAATADGGRESDPAATTIKFDGQLSPPDLYVLAIGINRFAKDAGIAPLDFCVSDTKAVAELFQKRSGKLYRWIHVTPLLDDQATKSGILKAVTAIATKAQAQDTLVVYVASHGITVGQRFYVIPHDFKLGETAPPPPTPSNEAIVGLRGYRSTEAQNDAVRARGLAIDELGEVLATVPALKRVLIFDTCHSGSAVASAGLGQNPFAFRGAMERFSRAQGVYCLSATAADELAAETKELGHSILTYALLAGAGQTDKGPLAGQALKPASGAVDVLEWFRYARQQVPALYEKYTRRPQNVELSGDDQPSFPLLSPRPN